MECDFFMYGSIVALITPFDNDNNIDYEEVKRLCDYHLENKTDGLLLLGTTAEAEALSDDEKYNLVKYIYEYIDGRIKLMLGLISNKYEEVIHQADMLKEFDIDSYLVIAPYYIKSNDSGLLKYFTFIADRINKPIIIYNVPKRSGFNIPFDVIKALSYHKNIIGIKEATSDPIQLLKLINISNDSFKIYCGDDSMMLIAMMLGAQGCINVIGNAFPLEIKLIMDSIKRNPDIAKTTFYKLFNLMNYMYKEVSPIGIKYIMYLIGFNKDNYRLPLDTPSKGFKRELEKLVLEIVS